MKALRNLIHFVGLTEEEESQTGRLVVQERPSKSATAHTSSTSAPAEPSALSAALAVPVAVNAPQAPEHAPAQPEATPIRPARPLAAVSAPAAPAVGEEVNRIETIHPTNFNDARLIGEVFREGIPVIMNLTAVEHAEAVRMVDFATGLIYGTHGNITRVTERVFLLTPAAVSATEGETTKVAERDFAMLG